MKVQGAEIGMPFDPERRSYRRFPLEAPVKLAPEAAEPEIETATSNISAAGVYFTVPVDLAPGTELEWDMELPGGLPLGTRLQVHCVGTIVRKERPGTGRIGLAVAVKHYTVHYIEPPTPSQPEEPEAPPDSPSNSDGS